MDFPLVAPVLFDCPAAGTELFDENHHDLVGERRGKSIDISVVENTRQLPNLSPDAKLTQQDKVARSRQVFVPMDVL